MNVQELQKKVQMNAQELRSYRQIAFTRLRELLSVLPEKVFEVDYAIDQLIRILSNLPARIETALPYIGLYGMKTTPNARQEYRHLAVNRLQALMAPLPALHEADGAIDGFIRTLSNLPSRPADALPYVRLFKLPIVTTEQLLKIAGTYGSDVNIQALTPGVNDTLVRFNISTPLRIAHFLAQIMHESGGFHYLREIWGPTEDQLGYEGRRDLGNTEPGDGFRFLGRGLIQLTGRDNYQRFSDAIGVDFIAQPERVEQAPYAVLAAGWFWDREGLNNFADRDDLLEVTYRINGGFYGLSERETYLSRAKAVLL